MSWLETMEMKMIFTLIKIPSIISLAVNYTESGFSAYKLIYENVYQRCSISIERSFKILTQRNLFDFYGVKWIND